MMNRILVTGGAGYIGSHTVVQLLLAGHEVVILDNLSNSKVSVLDRIRLITQKVPLFIKGDIRDPHCLQKIFSECAIDAVVHFAGLKAVGESVANPLMYYDNNVFGSLVLLQQMAKANVHQIVFSSSATVYGDPKFLPYTEDHPMSPTNPYGQTKLTVEKMLIDWSASNPALRIALLRYFNPVGAHPSGSMGEDPSGVPNNLMPFVAQVAVGKRKELSVFGGDYKTKDGTGVRDYIHVVDLADGHLAALNYLNLNAGLVCVNLGTGNGTSVLELIQAFKDASGVTIPYKIVDRRAGDLPEYYAETTYAKKLLGWQTKYDVKRMCEDTWLWQSNNSNGYPD